MICWDSIQAEERSVRQRRHQAAVKLAQAERNVRLARLARRAIYVLFTVCLVTGILAGSIWSGIVAPVALLMALASIARLSWTYSDTVEARRSGLRHVQREYDAVFARLIAEETS